MSESTHLQEIFQDTNIGWGSKYPRETLLEEIWRKDRDYLLWAANLKSDRGNKHPLPPYQLALITLAYEIGQCSEEESTKKLEQLQTWRLLSREGIGIDKLPRPSVSDCQNIISRCNLLGAHSDLDGIYSAASAIFSGGALDSGKMPGAFHRLRLFRYGFRNLADYTEAFFSSPPGTSSNNAENETCSVVIDFAAHPEATLTLDHHATALSYWEFGTEIPNGVYDPRYPSCPSLLAECCGLKIPEETLRGCDKVDGARYASIEETSSLDDPYVALEFALGVEVSDLVAKKAILTLAESALDPYSLLDQPIWKARVELVRHEFEEQRRYWQKPSRYHFFPDYLAVADARQAPYSSSRFRYMPFENEAVRKLPYLVTIRPKNNRFLNLGISRNPFYPDKSHFETSPKNLGALAKSIGDGGGRIEAAAVSIEDQQLDAALLKIREYLTKSGEA